MPDFTTSIAAIALDGPSAFGLCVQPPVLWHSIAGQWNAEAGSSVTSRYNAALGEHHGQATPVMQDTFLPSVTGASGTEMVVVTGNWRDGVSPWSGKHRVLFDDGGQDQSFDISSAAVFGKVNCDLVVIRRGCADPAAARNSDSVNSTFEFCTGSSSGQYRIALSFGLPISLQFLGGGLAALLGWQTVAVARDLGDFDRAIAKHGGELRIHIIPDLDGGNMMVEIGDGHWLRHAQPRPKATNPNGQATIPPMPNGGGYRFSGKNGWASLEIYPLRFGPVTITPKPLPINQKIDVGSAQAIHNGLTVHAPDQATSTASSQDAAGNLGYTTTAARPDAGEGLGSDTPPKVSDVLLRIPARYQYFGSTLRTTTNLKVIQVHETQVMDDDLRLIYTRGQVVLNNFFGDYKGSYGNFALMLEGNNGLSGWWPRLAGWMENIELVEQGAGLVSLARASLFDKSHGMDIPLGYELICDGWHLFTAIRVLANAGNIDDPFIAGLPDYGFPDDHPNGLYPDSTPGPILGRGLGLNPKYRITPDQTCLGAILDILKDQGQLEQGVFNSVASAPFYLAFDPVGQMRVFAYDAKLLKPVMFFSDTDTNGYQIQEIQFGTDVSGMRTAVDLQGLDVQDNSLLMAHLPLDGTNGFPDNRFVIGRRSTAFERSSRFCSQEAIQNAATTLGVQASLPVGHLRVRVPWWPNLYAGDLVYVSHYKLLNGGVYPFIVKQLDAHYGLSDETQQQGEMPDFMELTLRSASSDIVF